MSRGSSGVEVVVVLELQASYTNTERRVTGVPAGVGGGGEV